MLERSLIGDTSAPDGELPKARLAARVPLNRARLRAAEGDLVGARAALIEHYLDAAPNLPVREILEHILENQAPLELTALRPAQARKLERSMARLGGKHGERIVARLVTG